MNILQRRHRWDPSRTLLPWLMLLLLFTLSAAAPPAFAAAAERVTLQLSWDHQFQFAGYYAAQLEGYYKEVGLEVEIRSAFTSDGTLRQAVKEVAEGRADFGIGTTDILLANEKRTPLLVLATIFQQTPLEIYALPNTKVHFPHDLMGVRIARSPHEPTHIEIQALLISLGLDPALISYAPAPSGSSPLNSLLNGRVDVIAGKRITTPYRAQQAGMPVTSLQSLLSGSAFCGDSLFTTTELMKHSPQLVTRFREASLKGWNYALKHPEDIAEQIVNNFPRIHPVENVREFNYFQIPVVKKLMKYPEIPLGQTDPFQWKQMHASLRQLGLITDKFSRKHFIYTPKMATHGFHAGTILSLAAVVLIASGFIGWNCLLHGLDMLQKKEDEFQHTRAALSEYQTQLATVLETMNEGLVITDEQGQIQFANKKFCDMTGYSRDEVLRQSVLFMMTIYQDTSEEENLSTLEIFKQAISPHETTLLHKEGKNIGGLLEVRPLYDVNGAYAGSLGLFTEDTKDRSAQSQAQLALSQSDQTLRDMLNATYELVALADKNRTLLAINSTFAVRHQKAPQDLIGMDLSYLLPEHIAAYREKKSAPPREQQDGRMFSANVHDYIIYPLLDPDGNVFRFVVFSQQRPVINSTELSQELIRLQRENEQLRRQLACEPLYTI